MNTLSDPSFTMSSMDDFFVDLQLHLACFHRTLPSCTYSALIESNKRCFDILMSNTCQDAKCVPVYNNKTVHCGKDVQSSVRETSAALAIARELIERAAVEHISNEYLVVAAHRLIGRFAVAPVCICNKYKQRYGTLALNKFTDRMVGAISSLGLGKCATVGPLNISALLSFFGISPAVVCERSENNAFCSVVNENLLFLANTQNVTDSLESMERIMIAFAERRAEPVRGELRDVFQYDALNAAARGDKVESVTREVTSSAIMRAELSVFAVFFFAEIKYVATMAIVRGAEMEKVKRSAIAAVHKLNAIALERAVDPSAVARNAEETIAMIKAITSEKETKGLYGVIVAGATRVSEVIKNRAVELASNILRAVHASAEGTLKSSVVNLAVGLINEHLNKKIKGLSSAIM